MGACSVCTASALLAGLLVFAVIGGVMAVKTALIRRSRARR